MGGLLFFDEAKRGQWAAIFIFMEFPLKGLFIGKVKLVHVFGLFQEVFFHELDSGLCFVFFMYFLVVALGQKGALYVRDFDASSSNRHGFEGEEGLRKK